MANDYKENLYQFLKVFIDLEEPNFRTLFRWQLAPEDEDGLWWTFQYLGYDHQLHRAVPSMKKREFLGLLADTHPEIRSIDCLREKIPRNSAHIIFSAEFLNKDALEELRSLSERRTIAALLISLRDLNKVITTDSDLFLFKTIKIDYGQFAAAADLLKSALGLPQGLHSHDFTDLLSLVKHVGDRDQLATIVDSWIGAMKLSHANDKVYEE
jgi:hypothetical protein